MNLVKALTKNIIAISVLASVLVCGDVIAEAENHDAHEHGVAQLTVAVSGGGFEVALESPGANIFGFEYIPSTAADKATVDAAIDVLKSGEKLFIANDTAACKQTSVTIDPVLLSEHKDDHEDGHKDEYKTESDSPFRDIDVSWNFSCDNTSALKHLNVQLFSAFPGRFTEIDVDWVSDAHVGTVELANDGIVLLTQ